MPSPSRRPHVVRDDKRQRRDQGQHRILRPRTLRHVLHQVNTFALAREYPVCSRLFMLRF